MFGMKSVREMRVQGTHCPRKLVEFPNPTGHRVLYSRRACMSWLDIVRAMERLTYTSEEHHHEKKEWKGAHGMV
jgi:hypothetical protein